MRRNQTLQRNRNLYVYKTFLKISFMSYFKSPINVFLGIVLNIIILLSWLTFKSSDPFILSSILGVSIIRNAMYLIHRVMILSSENALTIRMRQTPVSPVYKTLAMITFSLLLNIAVCILLIAIAMAAFPIQREMIAHVNWFLFLPSTLLLWLLCTVMAYLTYLPFKRVASSQSVSMIIYVISYNFMGCAFPYYIISQYDGINDILYLFAPRYMMNVIQASWVNAPNLVYSSGQYFVDFGLAQQLWIPFVATIIFITIMSFICVIIYRHKQGKTRRDEMGVSLKLGLRNDYIKQIKKTNSVEELKILRENHRRDIKGVIKKVKNNRPSN